MEKTLKITDATNIFVNNFIEVKAYYMYCFNTVPCVTWIDKVNTKKVLKYIKEEYASAITGIFQCSKYDWLKKDSLYSITIIVLNDNCMIELSRDYCEILHTHKDYDMANKLIRELTRFKVREKKTNFEINLISKESWGLDLKAMEIKKTKLDLGLYYEDDFLEVDKVIKERMSKQKDKGIVLLHGLPGTGKTTYLRYLIGKLKKKVLFLSPAMAGNIMNSEFMDLLVDNPNCVLVIEDAENILLDRKLSSDSSVSNLLNISDGLLADFLNVQVICTFNQPLSMIDSALMRKGRLIARYEFGKLGTVKAQTLSNYLGFDTKIHKPMTIAEITGQHEKLNGLVKRTEIIGFRTSAMQN